MERVLRPPSLSLASLLSGLSLLPEYRDLFVVLTLHRIKVRYRHSLLGPLWALLQPLAMLVIFTAVFTILSPRAAGDHPYALFAYAGLLPWAAFATALSSGAGALVTNSSLVTRVYFPREILPVTYVAVALIDLLIASSVLLAMLAYYSIPLTVAALWALPILLLLAVFASAVALALAAVNVRYRDVTVAMPLLLQFWMFASPVIYPFSAVPGSWRPFYALNPMTGIVDGFRRALLDGLPPDATALVPAVAVTAVALPAAYLWFKHVDATMADEM